MLLVEPVAPLIIVQSTEVPVNKKFCHSAKVEGRCHTNVTVWPGLKGVVIALGKINVAVDSTLVAATTNAGDGTTGWFGNQEVMPG